jgi:hypothetical protein
MAQRPGARKSWRCYRCGEDVVEGMKFTFTRQGAVHWECFRSEISSRFNGKVPEDVEVLLELIDYLNEGIVRVKEYEYRISDESLRQSVSSRGRLFTGEVAKLMSELNQVAERHGVKLG